MNLFKLLRERAVQQHPVRVGLIGAGKFGSMYLAQAARTPGIHVLGIADLELANIEQALARIGWAPTQYAARSFDEALRQGTSCVTTEAEALIAASGLDVVIDATGSPAAGVRHVALACEHQRHIVMVNVETDALLGPMLARRAEEAGVVYSLAYGDQPALICEMVDWARACGLEVVCAGKGTKYLPRYHASTPDTVWEHYGLTAAQASAGGMNPQMFNSFLDGTKSAIEMAAVANATGLDVASGGLRFPPCNVERLHDVLKPVADGGCLPHGGLVEVISSMSRDGTALARDLRWGVYTVFEAPDEYVARCFQEYGLQTDDSGRYASMYKPYHLIGLELGISVASVALRGEPTGAPMAWKGDVVATAKRDLKVDEVLDGEGGYTVWGRLTPAAESLACGHLPLGLAQHCRMKKTVNAGEALTWDDVEIDDGVELVKLRREFEQAFGGRQSETTALAAEPE